MKLDTLKTALISLCLCIGSAHAGDGPIFMKDKVEGKDFPKTFGVSVDFFSMQQDLVIDTLAVTGPGIPAGTPITGVDIENNVDHKDIKLDAWVLPFMNVFAIYGRIDGETDLDMQANSLGVPLATVRIPLSGTVTGYGTTLAYGHGHWFGSMTATWSDTALDGGFTSDTSSTSYQFRFGRALGPGDFWVGYHTIETDETHNGAIDFPLVGPVDFDVVLSEEEKSAFVAGGNIGITDHIDMTLEFSLGADRSSVLFNAGYRF